MNRVAIGGQLAGHPLRGVARPRDVTVGDGESVPRPLRARVEPDEGAHGASTVLVRRAHPEHAVEPAEHVDTLGLQVGPTRNDVCAGAGSQVQEVADRGCRLGEGPRGSDDVNPARAYAVGPLPCRADDVDAG